MTKIFINRVERFSSVDDVRKSRLIELIVLSWKTAAVGTLILKSEKISIGPIVCGWQREAQFYK